MHSGSRVASEAEVLDYLLTNVRRDGDCLIWAGALSNGRPVMMWRGKTHYAVRLLLKLLGRLSFDAPKTRATYHTCDNARICMNPAHIQIGPHRLATKRAAARGAYANGVQKSIANSLGRGKRGDLSISDYPRIKARLAAGATVRELAQELGTGHRNLYYRLSQWRRWTGEMPNMGNRSNNSTPRSKKLRATEPLPLNGHAFHTSLVPATESPYAVLGVPRAAATDAAVHAAFRKLAAATHPDRSGGSSAAFARVASAYAVLRSAESRAQHHARERLQPGFRECDACGGTGMRVRRLVLGAKPASAQPCAACAGTGLYRYAAAG